MHKLTLTLLVILSCYMYSCKKDSTDPVNDKPPGDISNTIDFRKQYKGLYRVNIRQHSASYNTYYFDTSYTSIMKIDYSAGDSILWRIVYEILTPTGYAQLKLPAISLYDTLSNKLYATLGVDSTGKTYPPYRPDRLAYGGFIGTDSINCSFGFDGNHDESIDTLIGHKL